MRKKILIAFALLAALAIVFFPQLLSSSLGKSLIEQMLSKKLDAHVLIGALRFSWFGPQTLEKITFEHSDVTGSIEILQSHAPLWKLSQFGNAFLLKNGIFAFVTYNNLKVEQVQAEIKDHELQASGVATQGGRFSISGKIYARDDFDIVASLNDMPPAPLDQLLRAKGILSAGIGPNMNASLTVVYHKDEGMLNLDLLSTNANCSVRGQISNNILILKEPFKATLRFSHELAQALKERIVDAKEPITLLIEPEQAAIPLCPFSLDGLEIKKGTLDLKTLVFQDIPWLVSFLKLLNRGSLAQSKEPVWFTPIVFSMHEGLLHLERIDALVANAVHLCTWGDIDLPSNSLDMIVGLPADTLKSSLGIKGLPRQFVLRIPVKGSIQHPKYDTGSAAAKIAALIAGSQVSKKTGILGPIFNQMTQPQEDKDTPPPNRPFPWE